jgi:hypothetical protein
MTEHERISGVSRITNRADDAGLDGCARQVLTL